LNCGARFVRRAGGRIGRCPTSKSLVLFATLDRARFAFQAAPESPARKIKIHEAIQR